MNKHQSYWASPPDEINKPETYAGFSERSDYLLRVLRPYVNKTDSILELGCNVGRNLAALWDAGYHNIQGVDINPSAIELGKGLYPPLKALIHHDIIEDFIKTCSVYDCIFTLAVLMHLSDDDTIKLIQSKVGRVLITIEDERTNGERHFARNYKRMFTRLQQTHTEKVHIIPPGLTTRVFTRGAL